MTEIQSLIQQLSQEDWLLYVDDLSKKLKPKIQKNGAIKPVRDVVNKKYQNKINDLYYQFILDDSIKDLDDQIKSLTDNIYKINNLVNNSIYFEFFHYLKNIKNHNSEYDDLIYISNLMEDNQTDISLKLKLNNVISQILNQSISQSNKSVAGGTGELITESILKKIGFKEGSQYKKQFKSNEGSDTDFVFPYVEDFDDINVQIFMAVQYSTNDRARLTSSELKTGGEKISLTYNDFPSSTKKLKDIGNQIVEDYKKDKIRLVAYSEGIKKEILRCEKNSNSTRVDYFQNYAISFEDYFERLRNRFS